MRLKRIVIIFVVCSLCFCINQKQHVGREIEMQEIKNVMDEYTNQLMNISGVVGVYIGETEKGELCIRVMVAEKTKALEKQIPSQLDNFPVEIEETGEIRPLENNN